MSGWSPANLNNGTRDSAWSAYLKPNVNRPNLDVLTNAHVTKVVRTGTLLGQPIFRGVEFAAGRGGTSS